MEKIVVVGGGGHAKAVIAILKKLKQFDAVGYVAPDDQGTILGVLYLGSDEVLTPLIKKERGCSAVVGVGYVEIGDQRRRLSEKLTDLGYQLPPVVSPTAVINGEVEIGEGTVIHDGVIVNAGTKIGRCAILNNGCVVDHDCSLGDFVHVAPRAVLGGGVAIGVRSIVGIGSTIVPYRRVGESCYIGAGAVVIADCQNAQTYVGVPAKSRVKVFSPREGVFIIAEAGVNHNGKLSLAKKLVDAAKAAGCDAVKFQTFKAEKVVSIRTPLADYQKRKLVRKNDQLALLKDLELSFEVFKKLKAYCGSRKIQFLSTPFDIESVDFLDRLDVSMFKVSSGDLTNIPFLKYIASKKKPMIVSTGMATLKEVKVAVEAIKECGNDRLILLHCVSEYPAPVQEVNLRAIRTLRDAFGVEIGFSDHTNGFEAAIAAVALGAKMIEKHLTLRKDLPGPDHKASSTPSEFKKLVCCIRNIEKALGDGIKRPANSELKNRDVARRSIVAARSIKTDEVIARNSLTVKRPGSGIAPNFIDKIIGLRASCDIEKDDIITWQKIKSATEVFVS